MPRLKYYNAKTEAWEPADSVFGTENVKTVNGVGPDVNGNIEVTIPEIPEISYPVTSVNGMTGDVVIETPEVEIPEIPEQVQADLSQNDPTQPDYVKNRTHYEENNQTVIEWDGNTEGRDSFELGDTGATFYKVSDLVPQEDTVVGGTLAFSSGESMPVGADAIVAGEGGYMVFEPAIVMKRTNATIAGVSIEAPSTGIYFVSYGASEYTSSLTYGSTVVHPLDEKFIPESIARIADIPTVPVTSVNGMTGDVVIENTQAYTLPTAGTELGGVKNGGNVVVGEDGTMNVEIPEINYPVTSVNGMTGDVVIEVGSGSGSSVQADLSQNDETAADYVKNRTHWKEEATEILFSETNIDFSDTVSRPASFQLDEGAYIVAIDGEAYYYELSTYNGTNYIGDIQGNPIAVLVREGDLSMAMANGGVHSIEIYRDKTIYHKLDSRYIDAVQEFIIPIDFNNATLTDSATSGHFAGSQRYKVAIETPYYEIVKEYSAGKHLIVRLDNMGYQSYFFTLVSTDGTSFRFESTFIMSPNTTRITNLYLELGQQSIGSDTAKVFLQTTTIETNMPPEPASAIADLTEAPTAEDFNALLAALRSRGYLATE